ncbi:MAG: FIST C-terminal domain-containing protein [Rhodocyclales bacterium]|nr:FIST C-terminal domain-containing protein [Rhodocyclales bacterium]
MTLIATALASADKVEPELAADVVRAALERAGIGIAHSVLLFLSADFAHQAHAAVLAASRAAHCLQVTGCTAPGVFTEEDWVLDRPAACAMVFGGDCGLAAHPEADAPLLTLAAPNAATRGWLESGGQRYGLLSTDNSAHGAGRIWCHGKMAAEGRCETAIAGARAAIGVSRGMRILCEPRQATVNGRDVLKTGKHPALNALLRELPLEMRELEKLPFHLLAAGIVKGRPERAIEEGRYALAPIIAASHDERSVTLSVPLEADAQVFWAMRQGLAAENDMRRLAGELADRLGATPDFGLIFSCLGRGPYFFGGEDRDLAVVKERFPGMPLIGAYGGGQIAPLFDGNGQVHNAAVLALFDARTLESKAGTRV